MQPASLRYNEDMKIKAKVISMGVPWIENRLQSVHDFWKEKVDIDFAQIVFANPEAAEMMQWGPGTSVLDTAVVNRWRDTDYDMTILCAPYMITPLDPHGTLLHPSVYGLMISAQSVLEVFANQGDHSYGSGIDLGPTFEQFLKHEIAHYLYLNVIKTPNDRTHEFFYGPNFSAEMARADIFAQLP